VSSKLRVILSRRKDGLSDRLRTASIYLGYHSQPKFLIIGAQKAGTTALYYYLADHPDIVPSTEKELGFFSPEIFGDWQEHPNHSILCTPDGAPHFSDPSAHRRARAWYHSHFPPPHRLGRPQLTFEATPEYLYYPLAPARISHYDPEMKLIALLRDPVDRAFAAWNMYSRFGDYRARIYAPRREVRDFKTAVEEEINDIESGMAVSDPGYVRRGLYYEQLERYFAHFERGQILVLDSRELMRSTSAVVNEVLAFLALSGYQHGAEWAPVHVGEYETTAPSATRCLLQDFYKPHNETLYRLLGHDFEWS
jgi:Sulfotransferase family